MRSFDEAAAASAFAALEPPYKILVFRTIEEAVSCEPPRVEATFAHVVAAYSGCQDLVGAARAGQLAEHHLEELAHRIEQAGGVIAPDLRSHGEASVAAIRAASFEGLRAAFSAPVVGAAIAALNARLRALQPQHLDQVFHCLRVCLDPLLRPRQGSAGQAGFRRFSPDRQLAVLRAYAEAVASQPPRPRAGFEAIVAVHEAEQALLQAASEGHFDPSLLVELEARLSEAGGYLSPDLTTQGPQSLTAFRTGIWDSLERRLHPDVALAVRGALDVRLAKDPPGSTAELIGTISRFLHPLLDGSENPATARQFMGLDPDRQARVYRTIEAVLAVRPESDALLFDRVVTALSLERDLVDQAAAGHLGDASLADLQRAIEAAGGEIVPAIRATGEGSIAEFRSHTFQVLEEQFDAEVVSAAVATLNTRLKLQSPSRLEEVMQLSRTFLGPLLPAADSGSSGRGSTSVPPAAAAPAAPAARETEEAWDSRISPFRTGLGGWVPAAPSHDPAVPPVGGTPSAVVAAAEVPGPPAAPQRVGPEGATADGVPQSLAPRPAERPDPDPVSLPAEPPAAEPVPSGPAAAGSEGRVGRPGEAAMRPPAPDPQSHAAAGASSTAGIAPRPPAPPRAPLPSAAPLPPLPPSPAMEGAPDLERFIQPLLVDMGIAVARMERQSLPELLHQHGILRSVARESLLCRLRASVVFTPEEEAQVTAALWEGQAGEAPRRPVAEWIADLPADLQPALLERWDRIRLRRWQDEAYRQRLESWFEARRADLETVVFGVIRVADPQLADDLHRQLLEDSGAFGELAGRFSLGAERLTQGLVGPVAMAEVDPAWRAVLADLPVGHLHPPLSGAEDVVLLRMVVRQPASLDGDTRSRLLDELLEADLRTVLDGHLDGIHASLVTARPFLRSQP